MGAVLTHAAWARPTAFELRRTPNGNWIVEGPDDRCGGIFIDEAAARHFIHEEERAVTAGRRPACPPCLLRTSPTPRRKTL